MQQGQQMEKNPNGGYLNKSQYGMDSWYGKLTITPELLAQAKATGAITVMVKDIQSTQYGQCRRVIAKPYSPTEAVRPAPQGNYAPPPQQGYAPAPQYGHNPHAGQGQYQQAPVQNFISDEIPF